MISFSTRSWDNLSQHLQKASFFLSLIFLTHPAQAILDTNSNTLSDLWEKQYNNQQLFPATAGNLPEDDSDGDGWTNAQEAAAGTDPKNANPPDGIIRTQLFRFPSTSFIDPEDGTEYTTPEAFEITWPTLTGKQYTLIASENLTFQSWIPIGPPFIATGGITKITVPVTQPDGSVPTKLFWRIAVEDTDADTDGLTDHEEHLLGTNPAATDSDLDGLTDHAKMHVGLNPNHPDYDLDGILDGSDSTPFANNAIANPDGENLPAALTAKLTGRWDLEIINIASGIRTTPNSNNSSMPATLGGAIAADPLGMVSKATRMSGINQYLRTHPSTVAARVSFSISLWFRFEKNYLQNKPGNLNTVLFAYNDVLDATPLFQVHAYKAIPTEQTQKLVFSHYSNGFLQPDMIGEIPLSAALDDGEWQHLTLTKSAGTFRIYRNSQQVISGGGHSGIWATGANAYLCFGALVPSTLLPDTNFRGSMDRICTWSNSLSQTEVITLYQQDIDRDGLWDITESATRYSDYQSAIPYHPLPNDPNAAQPTQTGYARSPYIYSNSTLDFDQDELNDLAEQAAGTRLTDPDTDQDNLTDGFEVTYNFNPLTAYSLGLTNTSDDLSDPDSDNLTTLTEYLNGSDPRNPNTDGDATPDAIEINQGSDPANAADSGAAPTDPPYQVPIHINGDYTAWEATLKGHGPKDTRTRRFRMSDHNVPADETLELLRGNAYELTLRYIRSKPGESVPWYCWEASINDDASPVFIAGDQWIVDNTSGLLAEHTHSHSTNQIAEKKVDLLPVDIAVDADRDGEITFDGKDKTTAEKPYRFWINDDLDRGNSVDDGDWEEDDLLFDSSVVFGDIKDCDDEQSRFRRDLEDLTRLWIDFTGINSVFPPSDETLELKVRIDASSGTPVVNLYQPVETDGGREYLKDEAVGYNQLQGNYGLELCEVTSSAIVVPRRAWESLPSDKVIHLLFEGANEGEGKLIFELWKDGVKMCDLPSVYLNLKEAKDMYETWTVGDVTAGGVDFTKWPAASATQTSGQNLPAPEKPEEKDYIMFVHGWNMPPWEKETFASTMFKRMWHQGYKGRFGAFRWPTFHGLSTDAPRDLHTAHFDGSEQRAWNSAFALKDLLIERESVFGSNKIRLYAHSMGNVVSSEALRQMAPSSHINTYISAQAALSSHVWDKTTSTINFNPPLALRTPNVYGYYWQPGVTSEPHHWDDENRPSYMAPQYMPSGTAYINHYNPFDWALSFGNWQLNQALKPDVDYEYSIPLWDTVNIKQRFWKIPNRNLGFPTDRFEVFSYAAQSHGFATGQQGASGGMFDVSKSINLFQAYGFESAHKGHSAQFRSTIQKRWTYWRKALDDMKIINLPAL